MISNLLDSIRLLFRREKKPFLQLKEILGFYPHNINIYKLALMHKSIAYQERKNIKAQGGEVQNDGKTNGKSKGNNHDKAFLLNNERLEFLGDAVLGAIVADILYRHYGNRQEGFLTTLRSRIVRRSSLNKLAVQIGLDKLILHAGAVTSAHNSYMNGNAFEAFFGAIYIDRGYHYCYKFLEERIFKTYINIDAVSAEDENHKSALIEWCQKYQFEFAFSNREHREGSVPKFHSEVRIEGVSIGAGEGYSKKEADQCAAQKALRRIYREHTLKRKLKDLKTERKLKDAEPKESQKQQ